MSFLNKIPAIVFLQLLASMFNVGFYATTPAAQNITNETVSHGIVFEDRLSYQDTEFILAGTGLSRYKRLIKAYVGALYLGPGVSINKMFSDVPKRLEIEYFLSIPARGFVHATEEGIANNVSAEDYAKLKEKIDQFNTLYEDVKRGDRYSLTYIPGSGLELALNGEKKGRIQGAEFAAAVFSIWFGEKPFDEKFKQTVFGF
ncbi:MAG: chalcone isomerase family protein [Deltaproteobacteria bacterium]|nr:chalcone isomerase family protein [Deltaproteobacteria bacterium]